MQAAWCVCCVMNTCICRYGKQTCILRAQYLANRLRGSAAQLRYNVLGHRFRC